MPIVRSVLLLSFAALSLGCDAPIDDVCLPEAGCDGVVDIEEVQADPSFGFEVRLQPDWCEPESESLTYVAKTPQACAEVSILCAPGWSPFDDACGCGCAFEG